MAGVWPGWLADAARLTGFPVVEVAGWRTRGHSGYRVLEGVVAHHTAGPRVGEYPSLGVVRDGRVGLAGPLSAYGIGRSGTIYVIAAGVSWHAGASRWAGFTDLNDEFLGIEAESSGTGDWTAAQRDVYPRLCAAALHYMRRDASRIGAHREVALPAGRKPDPTGIDMPAMRAQVATMLADPLRRIPRSGTPAPVLEDDMPLNQTDADLVARTVWNWVMSAQGPYLPSDRAWVLLRETRPALAALGANLDSLAKRPTGQVDPAPIVAAVVDAITRAGIADQVVDALSDRLAR